MKTATRIAVLYVAFACIPLGFVCSTLLRAEPPAPADLAGSTWQLASYKYGDATEWENASDAERKIKMLTATHFVWISYKTASGEIQGTGGGTYTLAGPTYTEVVEFGNGNQSATRGKKQVFTLDLKGDRLEQTGQLSTGYKIAEVWQRVR